MLQCFEMVKVNSLTVRSMCVLAHSNSSGLVALELHMVMAHALRVALGGCSLAEVWAEESLE